MTVQILNLNPLMLRHQSSTNKTIYENHPRNLLISFIILDQYNIKLFKTFYLSLFLQLNRNDLGNVIFYFILDVGFIDDIQIF